MKSCQEFVTEALKEKIGEGLELEWINYIARDSRLRVKEYPAVIVESEPFDYNQLVTTGKIALVKDACNIIVLVKLTNADDEVKNLNDVSDDDLSNTKIDLKKKCDSIIKVLIDSADEVNNISMPEFGRAEDDIVSIDSRSIMMLSLSVSIHTKNDFTNS